MISTLPIESRLSGENVVRILRNEYYEDDILLELAIHDIGEDLELPVSMRAEAGLGVDAVFVDDSQRSELLVLWVMVSAQELVRLSCSLAVLTTYPAKLNVWKVLSQPWSA